MSLLEVISGQDAPNEVNVIIEIPMNASQVKYEVDKVTGILNVDRLMSTAMFYPANYGYIPQTLSEDGDPVDVLVITPYPVLAGSVIRVRPLGMLKMTDESGIDAKILSVPINKISKLYENVRDINDLPSQLLQSIEHFFQHYKDLEVGKWVKLNGWDNLQNAQQEILNSIARYK